MDGELETIAGTDPHLSSDAPKVSFLWPTRLLIKERFRASGNGLIRARFLHFIPGVFDWEMWKTELPEKDLAVRVLGQLETFRLDNGLRETKRKRFRVRPGPGRVGDMVRVRLVLRNRDLRAGLAVLGIEAASDAERIRTSEDVEVAFVAPGHVWFGTASVDFRIGARACVGRHRGRF